MVDTNVQSASITGLLRQGQKFGRIMDSPDIDHIIEVVRRHADLTEPVTRSYFDLIKMLTDSQKVPFSQSLSVLASLVNGVSDAVPLIGLAYDLLNGMEFLAHPDGVERMNMIMDQLAKLLFTADGIFAKHMPWLVPLFGGVMSALLPTAYSIGSMAPAYDRISGLLDRTSAAFPIVNGKVRLNLELTLDTVPGLGGGACRPHRPRPPCRPHRPRHRRAVADEKCCQIGGVADDLHHGRGGLHPHRADGLA